MRRYLIPVLVVVNLLLLLRLLDVTPAVVAEPTDPGRLGRQINAEQVTVHNTRR